MNVVSMLAKRRDKRPQPLPDFSGCKDVAALRQAIETLCVPFGNLADLEVQVYCRNGKKIRAPGLSRKWAICLLKLQTAHATAAFGAAYGLDRSPAQVLIAPELPDDFALSDEQPPSMETGKRHATGRPRNNL